MNDLDIGRALISREKAGKALCAAILKKRNKQVEEFESYWRTEFASAV